MKDFGEKNIKISLKKKKRSELIDLCLEWFEIIIYEERDTPVIEHRKNISLVQLAKKSNMNLRKLLLNFYKNRANNKLVDLEEEFYLKVCSWRE